MSFRLNRTALSAVQNALADSLEEGLEELRRRADEHVPHDEGNLELSGGVYVDRGELEGAVYYDTPYASRLHEHPEYNFQGKGQGKWLENATKDHGENIMKQIGERAGRKLR